MANESEIAAIEKIIEKIIIDFPDVFLVLVKIKPTNNVKVFIDTDEGITIETCIKVNRAAYQIFEESGLFPADDFSLEVSSPGIGEPLLLNRQYKKNIGRWLAVTLMDELKMEGQLMDCNETGITLEETKGKGKKAEKLTHELMFDQIKKATVEVKF